MPIVMSQASAHQAKIPSGMGHYQSSYDSPPNNHAKDLRPGHRHNDRSPTVPPSPTDSTIMQPSGNRNRRTVTIMDLEIIARSQKMDTVKKVEKSKKVERVRRARKVRRIRRTE